jgi:hypothetical protein
MHVIREHIRCGEAVFPRTLHLLRTRWGVTARAELRNAIPQETLVLMFHACCDEAASFNIYKDALHCNISHASLGLPTLPFCVRALLVAHVRLS